MSTIKNGFKIFIVLVTLSMSGAIWAQTININTADAQTIADALKGVGLSKAQAIIVWRNEHGQFSSLKELENVKGIGARTLAKNKGNIEF